MYFNSSSIEESIEEEEEEDLPYIRGVINAAI